MNTLGDAAPETLMGERQAAASRMQVQVMAALENVGALECATFQGGTSIALCYEGVRLSHDIDIAAPEGISPELSDTFSDEVVGRIGDIYGAETRVTPLKVRGSDSGVPVLRLHVKSVLREGRPDFPMVDVKVEFARVRAMTVERRRMTPFLPEDVYLPLLPCESSDEIVADKVVALCASRYLRDRDLWDIFFIKASRGIDLEAVSDMVRQKVAEYGLELGDLEGRAGAIAGEMAHPEHLLRWGEAVSATLVDGEWRVRVKDQDWARTIVSESLDVTRKALSKDDRTLTFDRGR